MPSTYSTNLRLELIATGEKSGTWGDITNTNMGQLLEEAIGGYVTVTVPDAPYTLTTNSGAPDEARNACIRVTGTLSATRNVICPNIEKIYVVWNNTTGGQSIVFKTASGTGVTIANGNKAIVFADGTNVVDVLNVLSVAQGGTGASTAATARTNLAAAGTGVSNTFTADQVISVNSSGTALRITQTGAGNALVVEDSANPDNSPFVIDAAGDVVVGHTAQIAAADRFSVFQGDSASYTYTNNTNSFRYMFFKSRATTPGTWSTLLGGETLGQVAFSGDDGTAFVTGANIYSQVDGVPATSSMPGRIIFATTSSGASTATERFRINSSGALGVAGPNFGTSGQVLISGGSSASPAWGTLGIAGGGTGATNDAGARANLGVPAIAANNTYTGIQYFNGGVGSNFSVLAEGGSEGGQFRLEKAPSGSTLAGSVVIDTATNVFRLYEDGGTYRGAYIELTAQAAAVGSKIFTTADIIPLANGGTGSATAAGARTNLGLGSIATQDSSSVSITGGSITGITDLAIADGGTGASTAAAARTNLGLGTIATQASNAVAITGGTISGITDLAIADGGTGASDAAGARTNLGLGALATLNTVGTSQIDDNSVTGAKIALGSDAQGDVMYYNGTDWARLGAGAAGQLLRTNGAAANPEWSSAITQGTAVASTSGSAIDFTNIPSWAKRITIMLSQVSTSGSAAVAIQLGDSGGVETTGYSGTSMAISSGGQSISSITSEIFLSSGSDTSSVTRTGSIVLTNLSGNLWVASGIISYPEISRQCIVSSGKSLSSTLTQIRISCGLNTFDAGSINILYE